MFVSLKRLFKQVHSPDVWLFCELLVKVGLKNELINKKILYIISMFKRWIVIEINSYYYRFFICRFCKEKIYFHNRPDSSYIITMA